MITLELYEVEAERLLDCLRVAEETNRTLGLEIGAVRMFIDQITRALAEAKVPPSRPEIDEMQVW